MNAEQEAEQVSSASVSTQRCRRRSVCHQRYFSFHTATSDELEITHDQPLLTRVAEIDRGRQSWQHPWTAVEQLDESREIDRRMRPRGANEAGKLGLR